MLDINKMGDEKSSPLKIVINEFFDVVTVISKWWKNREIGCEKFICFLKKAIKKPRLFSSDIVSGKYSNDFLIVYSQ